MNSSRLIVRSSVLGFLSLMSSFHVSLLVIYPNCVPYIIVTIVFVWCCWAFQFSLAYHAVHRVFGSVPGFDGFSQFWLGYMGLASMRVSPRERLGSVSEASADSISTAHLEKSTSTK